MKATRKGEKELTRLFVEMAMEKATAYQDELASYSVKRKKVLKMLKTISDWLIAELPKMNIPADRVLDTWLFESKSEWMKRFMLKMKLYLRLSRYLSQLSKEMLRLTYE